MCSSGGSCQERVIHSVLRNPSFPRADLSVVLKPLATGGGGGEKQRWVKERAVVTVWWGSGITGEELDPRKAAPDRSVVAG